VIFIQFRPRHGCGLGLAPKNGEIAFGDRHLLLNSYRLKRVLGKCIRSWSLVASNDRTLPLAEWTVIDSRNESREGEYELFQGFDCAGGPFRYFRLVHDGQSWSGRSNLVFWHIELFGCLFQIDP
jgi:hypothetical protein